MPFQRQTSERAGADLEALSDLRTPWCIRVAATFRIADHIAAGVTDVQQLAAAAACDADALHNVLEHLAGKGVFEETSPGEFALNDAARALQGPPPDLDLERSGGASAYAWGTFLSYVRTGVTGHGEVFGLRAREDLAAHPDLVASFDDLMGPAGRGTPEADIRIAGGWGPVKTVVDVGGGAGATLAEILRTRPHIHGTLVDHPEVVEGSQEVFEAAGVADRVTIAGQSLVDPLPSGADVYLLRKVINARADQEALAILRRCAEALPPSGRVVLIDRMTLPEEPEEPARPASGTRALDDFGKLAYRAGFLVWAAEWQPSGNVVIECRLV